MTPDKTFEEKSQSEEWGAWKFVSEMLDTPDENGIYQTSKCYEQIHDFVVEQKQKALTQHHQDLMSEVVGKLEGMKEDGETPFGRQKLHETEVAYNQALTKAQTIIKSK